MLTFCCAAKNSIPWWRSSGNFKVIVPIFHHVVAEALLEKLQKIKEEELIHQINQVCGDSEIAIEQHRIAESIANSTEVDQVLQ